MEASFKNPNVAGVAMFVFFFGINGIWLAGALFWKRSRILFWLASTLVVVGIGYLVATGAAANLARTLWPIPFDEVRGKELIVRHQCQMAWQMGTMLILCLTAPILTLFALFELERHRPRTGGATSTTLVRRFRAMILLRYPSTRTLFMRRWPTVMLSVGLVALLLSPVPESLARLVFSEAFLTGPGHCTQGQPPGT
jgi:hypothetical protein